MELSSSLQLERMGLGDAEELSPPSSPTSLSPDSSHAPTLAALPPELLLHIFGSFPTHPYDDRAADLSSLCLVNHHFLEIARPLLYHQVYLLFHEGDFTTRLLFDTLLNFNHCAKLVKRVFISVDENTSLGFTALASVLPRLRSLVEIRTGIIAGVAEDFARALHQHQSGLKRLELRTEALESSDYRSLLPELSELETLVGGFRPSKSSELDPTRRNLRARLQHFVSNTTLSTTTFDRILHSSWTSLTCLAFCVDPDHAHLDLERFKNLNTLRISIEDNYASTLKAPHAKLSRRKREMPSSQPRTFVHLLRSILRSAQTLSLATISIATEARYIAETVAPHLLFDLLPPSLCHFATTFEFLAPGGPNSREIVKGLRSNHLKHLKKITLLPSDTSKAPDPQIAAKQASKLGGLGILVVPYFITPGTITLDFCVEPYDEETDRGGVYSEGSEEEDDGSEVDGFRSDSEEEDDSEDSSGSDEE